MYSNPTLVRGLTPLLTTEAISDDEILEFIYQADSILDLGFSKRYATPITKRTNLTGTVTVYLEQAIISGSSTTFTDDIYPGDVVYILNNREPLKVTSVNSATSLTVGSNGLYNASGSSYFVMPRDIVTASMYLTANLIILSHFSEQAYNQETEKFNKRYEIIAKALIENIRNGAYYNTDLTAQSETKNNARLIMLNTDTDLRELKDDFESSITSTYFL